MSRFTLPPRCVNQSKGRSWLDERRKGLENIALPLKSPFPTDKNLLQVTEQMFSDVYGNTTQLIVGQFIALKNNAVTAPNSPRIMP